ncbi:MAG TPA: hypothetical protein PKD53_23730 [Chloroflexaceae bacterium]|nr:hypothetical protein [Chloroflexaceae bacterium]
MRQTTIVVVESDPSVRHLFDEVLHDEGYRVRLLEPRALCPSRLAAAAPDLVLLEITPATTPEVLALVGLLRRRPDTAQLPVLLSSTDHRLLEQRATELCRLGCDPLHKPFGLDDLLDVVSANLRRAAPAAAACAL